MQNVHFLSPFFSISRGLSPHREKQEPHFVSERPQSAPPPTPATAAGTSATTAAATLATARAASAERNDSSPTPAVGKRECTRTTTILCLLRVRP